MIDYWDYYLRGYETPTGGMGVATTLPVEHARDYVAELRAVVEEVTGKPIEPPVKQRIGFV